MTNLYSLMANTQDGVWATFVDSAKTGLLHDLLFLFIVLIAAYVGKKSLHVVIGKYFQQIYRAAKKTGRASSKKRYDTLSRAIKSMATMSVWGLALIVILAHYVPNPSALLTGAGAIGIFFGITSKDIVMDMYVGLMALIEDQYRVGDVIKINADHAGTVEDITLRTVKLRDLDGNVHIVPHSMARSVINKTYDYSMVNVEINAVYDADIDKVKKLIDDTGLGLANDPQWQAHIIEPIHYQTMLRFDDSQLTFRALGKVKPGEQWSVASEFRARIKTAFDEDDITKSLSSHQPSEASATPKPATSKKQPQKQG